MQPTRKDPDSDSLTPARQWTRRDFLRAGGMATAVLVLGQLQLGCGQHDQEAAREAKPAAAEQVQPLPAVPDYRTWEDLYRQKWTWDKIVCGTHTMTNCVGACAWNLYVKDGMVWREEQRSPYTATAAGLPDFNPRGCQKGACGSVLMYSPSRIRYPLRRVGERGEGKWERISWDEALDTIAREMIDAIEQAGPDTIIGEFGPNVGSGPNSAAPLRFFHMLGSPATDPNGQIGDMIPGATITLGHSHPTDSSDDWWRSSYIVLWAFNPSATRIPDAHYLYEGRYRGAKLVVVAPDYNASAIHADLWMNVRPGTDAALALAACQVIIEEGLYDAAYVAEQTDLSLLVRTDKGRFLRASDLGTGGSEDAFFLWDAQKNAPAAAPGSGGSETLALGAVQPKLDFDGTTNVGGRSVRVRTVFSMLREQLDRSYKPDTVEPIAGVSADTIRTFARGFAAAPSAVILAQYGSCKSLHSDLAQRAQILIAALTGNFGRPGGGWRSGGFFAPEGFGLLAIQEKLDLLNLGVFAAQAYMKPAETDAAFAKYIVPGTIWHAVHAGLDTISGDARYGDKTTPRPVGEYLREAIEKKWFPIHPAPGKNPRVLLSVFGNILRHLRSNEHVRATLLPKAKLFVDVNFRMSETGRWADIVLPAAFWYEKIDLKYLVSFVPYLHLGDRAATPLDEAKPEWEVFGLLAGAVAREAKRRNVQPYTDIAGEKRDARRLDDAYSDSGRFAPTDEEKAMEFVLKYSEVSKGSDLETMRGSGAIRFAGTGHPSTVGGYYSDYDPGKPLVPHEWFTEKKQPWPTLTGRQQFYIDHPWFLECGEALPTYKEPPRAGGDYPLLLGGGHTRWSIHSQWRDQMPMLRLQRGEPVVYISTKDAGDRTIKDHDLVRVRNDLGSFVLRAKVATYVPPGQILVYHAWEPYQFRGGVSDHKLIPSPLKATSLAGGYGHIHWNYGHWEPNQIDRDTRVEVELA